MKSKRVNSVIAVRKFAKWLGFDTRASIVTNRSGPAAKVLELAFKREQPSQLQVGYTLSNFATAFSARVAVTRDCMTLQFMLDGQICKIRYTPAALTLIQIN